MIYDNFKITNQTFPIQLNVIYSLVTLIYHLIDLHASTQFIALDQFCDKLTNPNLFLESINKSLQYLNKTINDFNPAPWPSDPSNEIIRQKYQYCTELGWIPTAPLLVSFPGFRILPIGFGANYTQEYICKPLFNKTIKNLNICIK